MNKVDIVERARLRTDLPQFRPGDTVKVHVKVSEGTRERIQIFQGVVIRKRGGGLRESFTVRKISFNGVGVERTFPLHSPTIATLEIVQHGSVRRAKLYYLRELTGRKAKIKERRIDVVAPVAPAQDAVPEALVAEDVTEPVAEASEETAEVEATDAAEEEKALDETVAEPASTDA